MTQRPLALHGLAKIMRLAFAGNNLRELTDELTSRINANGSDSAALLDLSIVHQLNSQAEHALELQWQALQQHQYYRLRSNPRSPKVRVLAIMGPGAVMANTPIEFLLEESDIALEMLYVGAGLPPVHDIPSHDVAFVAVCESDANQQLLQQLQTVIAYWPKPHINSPDRIAKLARDGLSDVLSDIAGIEVVASRRMARDEITDTTRHALTYPLIARPANSHAGQGLQKIDGDSQLDAYVRGHSDQEFSIAPFIDYRTTVDGLYRKYRVSLVAGTPYPAHMAVSPRWMVHYLNADMLENASNRAAEQRFMDCFDWEFGERHGPALAAIDQRLGLDYYSIDCGETPDGRLLVFELDSGAVVHSMDPVDLFPYKQPHMLKLFSAFHGLIKCTAWGQPAAAPRTTQRRRRSA